MKYSAMAFVTLIIMALIACGNAGAGGNGKNKNVSGSEYLIEGKITNAPASSQIYLDRYLFSQQQQTIDTATIAADGSFTFRGNLPEKGFYIVRLSQTANWLVGLFGGKLSFTADANNTAQYQVEGNPQSKAVAEFVTRAGGDQVAMNQMNQAYQQARMSGNVQNMISIQQQYTSKHQEAQEYLKNYADSTSSPLLALFAVSLLNPEENSEYIDKTIAKAEKEIPQSTYVKELKAKTEQATRLSMGKKAPEFELKNPKGENMPLSATQGKVVLLDFWASWCRPCRIENPNVVKLYDKYKSKGFEIYSVSLDQNMQKWVQAIEQDNLKWKYHGSNLQGWQCPVAKQYDVSSIPQTFLLDREGKIIAKNLRGQALEQKLQEIFGG